MKKVVERERNKTYYRVLHVPIWLWVFFILPGNMTYDLYLHGPDRRHAIWLAIVFVVCAWRGLLGRLPGVEPRPYVTHYGVDRPNLPYRVVCYTAAWIESTGSFRSEPGRHRLREHHRQLYPGGPLQVVVLPVGSGCRRRDATRRHAQGETFYRQRGCREGLVLRRDLHGGPDPGGQLGGVAPRRRDGS